ncbi:putative RNA-directed DNA polymerase, partial [Tanacetum coccineum]
TRLQARLAVKGFRQKKGIDFDEIFSPVVKMGSIRVVLGLAASLDLEVEQMDVKTAFLHGDLDKEIYMEQPEGFQVKGKEDYVCRLQKSLYGFGDDDFIILLLYVDDMLIVGKNIGRIAQLKQDLSKSFAMKDLGPAKQILGIRIFRDRGAKKFAYANNCNTLRRILKRMDRVPYASTVGSLMYAMVCTRPDLAHAIGVVSRFLSNPGGAVSWQSRLQKCVALSTTKAEYVASTEACKEIIVVEKIRDAIEDGCLDLISSSDDNASDMLTEACSKRKLKICDRSRDGRTHPHRQKIGEILLGIFLVHED